MKTVQKGEDLKRVKEDEAESLVKNKGYKYVPKSTYKADRVKAPAKVEPSPESDVPKEEAAKKKKK